MQASRRAAYSYNPPSAAPAAALPPPRPNGGLYTGTPAPAGAPWAAVPIIPDQVWMAEQFSQQSGFPAWMYITSGTRPGNNEVSVPGSQPIGPNYPHTFCDANGI